MHEWNVTLTQKRGRFTLAPEPRHTVHRHTAAIVQALDARDAARRAQKVLPGWTAVLVERVAA